jgi:hypothetical protein
METGIKNHRNLPNFGPLSKVGLFLDQSLSGRGKSGLERSEPQAQKALSAHSVFFGPKDHPDSKGIGKGSEERQRIRWNWGRGDSLGDETAGDSEYPNNAYHRQDSPAIWYDQKEKILSIFFPQASPGFSSSPKSGRGSCHRSGGSPSPQRPQGSNYLPLLPYLGSFQSCPSSQPTFRQKLLFPDRTSNSPCLETLGSPLPLADRQRNGCLGKSNSPIFHLSGNPSGPIIGSPGHLPSRRRSRLERRNRKLQRPLARTSSSPPLLSRSCHFEREKPSISRLCLVSKAASGLECFPTRNPILRNPYPELPQKGNSNLLFSQNLSRFPRKLPSSIGPRSSYLYPSCQLRSSNLHLRDKIKTPPNLFWSLPQGYSLYQRENSDYQVQSSNYQDSSLPNIREGNSAPSSNTQRQELIIKCYRCVVTSKH